MKKYIGTKQLSAKPMSREEYNLYRGWTIPENENPLDDGYLVVYDGGYESWSPKEVFEEAYYQIDNLPFSVALECAKKGKSIARSGWNGKEQYVSVGTVYTWDSPKYNDPTPLHHLDNGNTCLIFTGTRGVQMWVPSQSDLLSNDWKVI